MEQYGYNPVDDYKSRIELQPPKLVQFLQQRDSEFIPNIFKMSRDVEHVLNTEIPKTFPSYTLHDINHSVRIMENMYNLINNIEEHDELDIVLLVYVALLHDIGMSVSNDEKEIIRQEKHLYSDIKYQAVLEKYYGNEIEAMQDFIRRVHAKRSAIHLKKCYQHYMSIPSHPHANISDEVAMICESHTEDVYYLRNNLKSYDEKGKYIINPQYCAILLRLADICDCSSQRTPPSLYNLIRPQGTSDREWKGHFSIENSQIIKTDEKTSQKFIALYGRCEDANIHRKILGYIGWINEEIQNANSLTEQMVERYRINIKYPTVNKIEPVGYTIPDLRLEVDYVSITNLLMGENIYGSRSIGLRELIQNAIDACKVRKELEQSNLKYGDDVEAPMIRVILDGADNKVIIKDNGIGMTMSIIKKYFLNIGVSYYKSEEFQFKKLSYTPIGNYGIGFLACFMLSNDVVIKTRYFKSPTVYEVSLTKDSPYICLREEQNAAFKGTEIILNYSEFMDCFNNSYESVTNFVQQYFITEGIDVRVIDRKTEKVKMIQNFLELPKTNTDTLEANISDYLKGIEGTVTFEIKKKASHTSLEEISYRGSPYYYDGKSLHLIKEVEFDISKLYYNNSIRYVNIPIIDESSTKLYDKYFEVLDSVEDTIEKIENEIQWMTVFVGNCIEELPTSRELSSVWDRIVGDFRYEELSEYGHDLKYSIVIEIKEVSMVYSDEIKSFMRFNKNENIITSYFLDEPFRQVYVRNVLCKGVKVKALNVIAALKINECKINILRKDVIPDISRNKIDTDQEKLLNYAINKSVHKWIYDNHPLNGTDREMLGAFIGEYYSQNNEFLIDNRG